MATIPTNMLFDEILDFLAAAPTSDEIIAYQPSVQLQERASHLLQQNRDGTLTEAERQELDEFTEMNHFMSMLKIRARKLKNV